MGLIEYGRSMLSNVPRSHRIGSGLRPYAPIAKGMRLILPAVFLIATLASCCTQATLSPTVGDVYHVPVPDDTPSGGDMIRQIDHMGVTIELLPKKEYEQISDLYLFDEFHGPGPEYKWTGPRDKERLHWYVWIERKYILKIRIVAVNPELKGSDQIWCYGIVIDYKSKR